MIKNTENNNGKVVVLFEVTPTAEGKARYLELAAQLKLLLSDAKGFIRSERFSSLNEEGKLLSLNVWENEEAVEKWRNELHHRTSQSEGRERLFENYRITVASVIREYDDSNRNEAPADSNEYFHNSNSALHSKKRLTLNRQHKRYYRVNSISNPLGQCRTKRSVPNS